MLPAKDFSFFSVVSHMPRSASTYASSDSEPERERRPLASAPTRSSSPAPAPTPTSTPAPAVSSHAWRNHVKNVYASLKKVDPSTNYKEAMRHARATYKK